MTGAIRDFVHHYNSLRETGQVAFPILRLCAPVFGSTVKDVCLAFGSVHSTHGVVLELPSGEVDHTLTLDDAVNMFVSLAGSNNDPATTGGAKCSVC